MKIRRYCKYCQRVTRQSVDVNKKIPRNQIPTFTICNLCSKMISKEQEIKEITEEPQ